MRKRLPVGKPFSHGDSRPPQSYRSIQAFPGGEGVNEVDG